MKYTNYLINGNFIDIDQLISDKKIIKQFTILMAMPVAVVGLAIFSGMLPFTVAYDSARNIKYQYYRYMRKYHMYEYFNTKMLKEKLTVF